MTRITITTKGRVHKIAFDTVGLSGKRLRANLGMVRDLSEIEQMVESAREAAKLTDFVGVRGGM